MFDAILNNVVHLYVFPVREWANNVRSAIIMAGLVCPGGSHFVELLPIVVVYINVTITC